MRERSRLMAAADLLEAAKVCVDSSFVVSINDDHVSLVLTVAEYMALVDAVKAAEQ